MNTIKVLALDDDNHSVSFVTEEGVNYSSAAEFMRDCLLQPHGTFYTVRMIALVEEYCEAVEEEFDKIQFGCGLMTDDWREAFERLWAVSQEDFYV